MRWLVAVVCAFALGAGVLAASGLADGARSSQAHRAASPQHWTYKQLREESAPVRQAAVADAKERLSALPVPPEAKEVSKVAKSLQLSGPPIEPGSLNLIDRHRFWVTGMTPNEVLAWLKANRPPGSREGEISGGSYGFPGEPGFQRWVDSEWPEIKKEIRDRGMLVTVVERAGGGSAIRADSQAVWLLQRPQWERIPPRTERVEVERLVGKRSTGSLTLRDPKRVQGIVKLVNDLNLAQPEGPHGCTFIPSPEVIMRLRFKGGAGRAVLGSLVQSVSGAGCFGSDLTIRGNRLPELGESWVLVKRFRGVLAQLAK